MSAGCAARTLNQQLDCCFQCAQRTLHWVLELIRVSHLLTFGETPFLGVDLAPPVKQAMDPDQDSVGRLSHSQG